jgi:nitrogen PTS system EIIA component
MTRRRGMSLLDFLDKALVLNGNDAKTKSEVISTISSAVLKHEKLKHMSAEALQSLFEEREALGTTGIGHGIAIPHCKLDDVDQFVVCLATFPGGVEYEAMDGNPVVLAVAIVGPKDDNQGYVRLLSEISCIFRNQDNVTEVVSADSPEKILQILESETCVVDNTKQEVEYDLVQVYIQDEEIFDEVVEIFTSFDSMAAVCEVTPLGNYLSKVPLFASFWTERDSSFCRRVSSVIDRKWTNEFIRRIDNAVKGLSKADKICLITQPASYVAGSIGI